MKSPPLVSTFGTNALRIWEYKSWKKNKASQIQNTCVELLSHSLQKAEPEPFPFALIFLLIRFACVYVEEDDDIEPIENATMRTLRTIRQIDQLRQEQTGPLKRHKHSPDRKFVVCQNATISMSHCEHLVSVPCPSLLRISVVMSRVVVTSPFMFKRCFSIDTIHSPYQFVCI